MSRSSSAGFVMMPLLRVLLLGSLAFALAAPLPKWHKLASHSDEMHGGNTIPAIR
jgi:hypothetical protein